MAPIFKGYHSRATQVLNIRQLHVPWFLKSPGLNVIVHLWDELNLRVRKQSAAQHNRQELQLSLVQESRSNHRHSYRTTFCQWDRGASKSLELEMVNWTKLFHVAGPMYSKVTYDEMSPACDFIFLLLWYSPLRDFVTFACGVVFLFAMILN